MYMCRVPSLRIRSRSECKELVFSFFICLHPAAYIAMSFCPALFITLCGIDAILVCMIYINDHIGRRCFSICPVDDAIDAYPPGMRHLPVRKPDHTLQGIKRYSTFKNCFTALT